MISREGRPTKPTHWSWILIPNPPKDALKPGFLRTLLAENHRAEGNRSSPWFEPFSGLAQNMWAAEPGVFGKMTNDSRSLSLHELPKRNNCQFAVCRPFLPTIEIRGVFLNLNHLYLHKKPSQVAEIKRAVLKEAFKPTILGWCGAWRCDVVGMWLDNSQNGNGPKIPCLAGLFGCSAEFLGRFGQGWDERINDGIGKYSFFDAIRYK